MEEEYPTILVVDDTEDNLDFLEYALKRKPFKMLRAVSGKECLALAKRNRPDIILLDIQMPEMDGFQTLELLKSDPSTSQIPVIFLTAQRKDPQSIERGLALGANEFLTKPIDTEELLVRVRMLLRVKKLEMELERTKADFTAMLVHDLRSPLSGIKSVLEYFKETLDQNNTLSQEQGMLFDSVNDSAERMLGLINDILDLSKLESGNISLDIQDVDLHLVVDMITRDFRMQYKKKEATIDVNFPPGLPPVKIDINRIGQVLMNLLSNALKFISKGGNVTVTVSSEQVHNLVTKDNDRFVKVSVRDTGMGIPAEELPFIFDRYKQASTAKKTKVKGTGLGLAVCKLIVEAHGGSIYAESEMGKHTTFHFTLPTTRQ
jgi:two-component system sensor histidine kinase/response regulator